MNRYEGLFILNTAGREEGVKEALDRIAAEVAAVGGKVENTQKMDRRSFSRVTDKKVPAGFYVNVIFAAPVGALPQLRTRFALSEDVYRVMFTMAPEVTETPAVIPAA